MDAAAIAETRYREGWAKGTQAREECAMSAPSRLLARVDMLNRPSPKSNKLRIRSRFSIHNDATLFHGDCLGLLQAIPDNTVKLVVTSPPYNIGKRSERRLPFED
jgi:hypothetical protein